MFWKSLGNHPWFGSRSLFSRTISAIDDQFMMFFFFPPFFSLIKPVWLCKISTSYLTTELYFWCAISFCVSLHVFHCARNTNTNVQSVPNVKKSSLTGGCSPLCPNHWASRVEVIGGYHEYTDVKSCQDVVHLYHLLWSATILNIVALFLGIITAAVLGGFKDMVGLFNDLPTKETQVKFCHTCWNMSLTIWLLLFVSVSISTFNYSKR